MMKLTIPTSQSEITIKQFIAAQGKTEREQLAIYLNITVAVLDQLPQTIYDEALLNISNALQEEFTEPIRTFHIGSTEYGMVTDLNAIESGAFADAEETISKVDEANVFLNALYRPIKRKVGEFYSVKGYDSNRAVSLLDAPLSAYSSSVVFFYRLGNDLGIFTPNSTQHQASKEIAT
jgi:hypothetical protein